MIKRNPCFECNRHLQGKSKDSPECKGCEKRIRYLEAVEGIGSVGRQVVASNTVKKVAREVLRDRLTIALREKELTYREIVEISGTSLGEVCKVCKGMVGYEENKRFKSAKSKENERQLISRVKSLRKAGYSYRVIASRCKTYVMKVRRICKEMGSYKKYAHGKLSRDKEKSVARYLKVVAARRSGMTFQSIGDDLGVSRQRAYQIYNNL